jgi:DNA-binding response OmpR family regulator
VDKVIGLELGADDFIVKPFGVKEVVARIRAVTRRSIRKHSAEAERQAFKLGDIEVVPEELKVYRDGKASEISLRDLKILSCFHRLAGKVVDRDTLFNDAWGLDHMPSSRTLDQHISQLRKRIEIDSTDPRIIRTVHGAGYRYEG